MADLLRNNLLKEIIQEMSQDTGLDASIIEKDYWVTLFLKTLNKYEPRIIFKGGTSLSKCHKVIKRFSEDIDINIQDTDEKEQPSQKARKDFKKAVVKTAEELNVSIPNLNKTQSRRYFNKYLISYPSIFNSLSHLRTVGIEPSLIVETAMQAPSYPNVRKLANSYIGDFLTGIGKNDIIDQFDLRPFELTVQSLERTFVDKVFALCDYYYGKNTNRTSRHIYDIHRIFPKIEITDDLLLLIDEVRELRRGGYGCHSADPACDVPQTIKEILDSNFFKADYDQLTVRFFYPGEELTYQDAVETLKYISSKDYFKYRRPPITRRSLSPQKVEQKFNDEP